MLKKATEEPAAVCSQLLIIKAELNIKVFRGFLNVDNVELDVTSRGNVFQRFGAATLKARLP